MGGAPNDFGGFGNVDPELENVLRISLEEEKARELKKKEDEDKKAKEGGAH